MVQFFYRATDGDGRKIEGNLECADEAAARTALDQLNMENVEVSSIPFVAASITPTATPTSPPQPEKVMPKKSIPVIPQKKEQVVPVSVASAKRSLPPLPSQPAKKVSFSTPTPIASAEEFVPRTEDGRDSATPKKSYASLASTLQLYAGWLFAWYLVVIAIGYYSYVRDLSFTVPLVESLFQSSLVFSFMMATFLFLFVSALHTMLRGGVLKAIILYALGIGVFFLARKSF